MIIPTPALAPTVERIAFTPAEVAKAVGYHPDTIRDRIVAGLIQAQKMNGRYLIPVAEVERLFGKVPQLVG